MGAMVATFYDAGAWFMEAVVEYSTAPDSSQLFRNKTADVPYEGYPVQDSPLAFKVVEAAQQDLPVQTWCRPSQLNRLQGRWNLIGRMQPTNEIHSSSSLLGLRFRFQPYACRLLPLRRLLHRCSSLVAPRQVIFVGDSTVRLQRDAFQEQKKSCSKPLHWQAHYIDTSSGLRVRLGEVTQKLYDIRKRYRNSSMAVLFNSGLHDADKYCSAAWSSWRKATLGSDDVSNCLMAKYLCHCSNICLLAFRLCHWCFAAAPLLGRSGEIGVSVGHQINCRSSRNLPPWWRE